MFSRKNIFAFFIFLIPGLVGLEGCQRRTPQKILSSGKKPFLIGIETAPLQWDPRQSTDATSQRLLELLYDALVRIDENLKITPHLAARFEFIPPVTYNFELRSDVFFHDGSILTTQDVVQSIQSYQNPQNKSPFQTTFNRIKNIKIIDPLHFVLTLDAYHPSFLTDLTLLKIFRQKEMAAPLVGTGPYLLEESTEQKILLKAFDRYFLKTPSLPEISFLIIKDDNTRYLYLKKGEVDLIQNSLPRDKVASFSKDSRYQVLRNLGLNYQYLGFNFKDPLLLDRRIRKAIAFGINREEIITYLLGGLAQPASSLLIPSNPYYTDESPSYSYNLREARQLMKEAGFHWDPAEGKQAPLTLKTSTNRESIQLGEILASQLSRIGIRLNVETYEWGRFYEDIKNGNFQMFSLRWIGITDPEIYYELFHSRQIQEGKNRLRYSNPLLDVLLDKARQDPTPQRVKLYQEIQKVIAEDLPYVSLWHAENFAILKKDYKNYTLHPNGSFWPLVALHPIK